MKTRYTQFINYLKQVRNSSESWRLCNYTLKDNLLKVYLYLYNEGYINIRNIDDFIYILDNSTLCPCNTEYIDKNNYKEYEDTDKKTYNKYIKLLHYANPATRQIQESNIMIPCDVVKIIKFISQNERNFEIKGAIWFDKINGNSYNSSIIYDIKHNKTYKKPFEYGYGNQYYFDSINYLIENNIIPDIKQVHNYYSIFRDLGSQQMKKTEVKNHLYY